MYIIYAYTPVCIYVYICVHKCILYMLKVYVCVSVCIYTLIIHKKFVTYCQKHQFVVVIKGKRKSHSKPLTRVVINLVFKIGAGRETARWRGERGETGDPQHRRRCHPGLLSVLAGKEGGLVFYQIATQSAHKSGWNSVHLYFTGIFFWGGEVKAIKTRNTCWRSRRKNI